MPCIVLSTEDTTVNKKDTIPALLVYSLRKDFVYYRLDAFPTSIKQVVYMSWLSSLAWALTLLSRAEVYRSFVQIKLTTEKGNTKSIEFLQSVGLNIPGNKSIEVSNIQAFLFLLWKNCLEKMGMLV